MLSNYFKIAWRNLIRNKVSSLINMVGLTLGISVCLSIYLITSHELSYEKFHAQGDRIYRLVGTMKFNANAEEEPIGFVPYAMPQVVRAEITGLATVAAFHNFECSVIVPHSDKPAKVFERRNMENAPAEIIIAEPQYFDIFKYKWLAGNPKTALNEPYKVVLSEQKARKYFGDMAPDEMIGKELIYMDSLRMSVSGIVQDWTAPTDFTFTDFLSFSTISNSLVKNFINLNEWNDVWSASQAFVQLEQNTQPAQIEAQFPAFSKAHFTGEFKMQPALQPLYDLHFNADYGDNYAQKAHLPTLYGLMAIACFILILAAINFINLATAQSLQRAKEVGIRKVLGGSRQSLINQFMSETFLLTMVAIGLSLLVVPQALAFFQSFVPKGVGLEYGRTTLLFIVLIGTATALLSGLYPSFVLSNYLPAVTLKGQNVPAKGSIGLRKSLIVFQFTVSLFFILGTILVGQQINFMRNKDLGFRSDAVITLQAPRGPENKFSVLYPQIQQLTGVEKAALQLFEPMGENFGLDHLTYNGTTPIALDAAYKMGDENFIPFYEMKILAGRNLLKSDAPKELVVSESLVKAIGLQHPEDAVGKQIQWRDKMYPIVGVVADFHQQSMHEKIPPTFISTTNHAGNMAIKLKDTNPEAVQATLTQIGQLWANVYPENKFEYTYLDESIAKFYEKEQKTARLVNLVTLLAILISCLGLYGLSTFMAAQRNKEIGIRKVMGASVLSLVGLMSKDFLKLVLIALVIASPIAYALMQKWLADFAYRIDIQWWMFVLAGAVAMVIAFVTVAGQALRTATINPVQSLRNE
jgi:putative ABC transport system permease protein